MTSDFARCINVTLYLLFPLLQHPLPMQIESCSEASVQHWSPQETITDISARRQKQVPLHSVLTVYLTVLTDVTQSEHLHVLLIST